MTKFYVDSSGNYIGGFDGATPPSGSIEVTAPPSHASDKWDGVKFVPSVVEKKKQVQRKLVERMDQELPHGQLLSMMILLLKSGALTGAEIAEQATQRVTLGKIKALQAHAKQLEANLDSDVNADIESGW